MERFGRVASSIRNLSSEIIMHHMVTSLRPRPFVDSLCKQPVTNLDELRQRATKFMQLEELKRFKSQIRMDEGVHRKDKEEARWKKSKEVYHDPRVRRYPNDERRARERSSRKRERRSLIRPIKGVNNTTS